MGAKQTKIEGTYLPATPPFSAKSILPAAENENYDIKNVDIQDPRSPNICRTPINILSKNLQSEVEELKVSNTERAIGQLRRKFFKGFSYNLNDPRSPGYYFNRSQISFDDSKDKILNLDDTFADLFAETQSHALHAKEQNDDCNTELPAKPKNVQSDAEIKQKIDSSIRENESHNHIEEISSTDHEESKDISILSPLKLSPRILQDEIDPRSPTIGVDRTPIIFNDDVDETNESILLESILATLSLNMSDTSICSIGGSPSKLNRNDRQGQLFRKITHKRMRRTHVNEKLPLTTRRLTKDISKTPQRILENDENALPNLAMNGKTLKSKSKDALDNGIKRTPLSCIKNSGNLRLRMAKTSMKPLNARLEQDNDDSLVPES